MIDRKSRRISLSVGLVLGFLGPLCAAVAHARGAHYSLRELAKAADLIGFASVVDIGRDTLRLSISESLKGSKPGEDVTVAMPPISPFDGGYEAFKKGDPTLVFLKLKNGKYDLALGAQSVSVVASADQPTYRQAISQLAEYETAADVAARTSALKKMMRGGKQSKGAALNILALDPDTKSNEVLAKDVLALTKDADLGVASPATQVLGLVATKEEIDSLADLAGSPNKHVRQAARMALKNLTGNEVAGKDDDADAKRKDSVRNWKAWWAKNKGKVKLRK